MSVDETPNVALFDIGAILQGRDYPETEIPFYIDEVAALSLARSEAQLTKLAQLGKTEEHDKLEAQMNELKDALRSQRYMFHVRGIPSKTRQDVFKKAYEKYPKTQNFVGLEEDDPDRDLYYTALLWQAMTVKIVAPDGAVQIHPPLETIQQFRDFAPVAALNAIDAGIQELTSGVKAGFESAAQDTDFLSQP